MSIFYNETKKDLPSDELRKLFMSVGWSDGSETPQMRKNFNKPFIHSTLVISAWKDDQLIGAVRVLSDTVIRSIIYDLLVDPQFQNEGIGKELLRRCRTHFSGSEWLVQTKPETAGYYKKLGFEINDDVFPSIPSKYF